MSSTPNLNQVHFRIRTDTNLADGGTPTWAAAEDTSVSIAVETTFRIRFCVQNTGTAISTAPTVLRVSKNAGAYTAVTTTTGATLGAQSADASTSTDDSTIATANFLLTAGAGTAILGGYDETGALTSFVVNAGQFKEFEFGLILKTAGAAPSDTFDFRLYNSTTAFTTYTQTPRITVPPSSGTNFQPDELTAHTGEGAYNAAGQSGIGAAYNATQAVGDLVVLSYAVDNVATTDSDESACQAVEDTAGNIFTKAVEYTKSGGALQGGVTTGIWYCQLTHAVTATDSISAAFSSTTNRDAAACTVASFIVAGGKTVSVEATTTGVATASTTVPGLNPTTANIECLRIRANGAETNSAQGFATRHTSGWTALNEYTGNSGTAATSVSLAAEYRISTGTGDASSPSALGSAVDQSGVYVAFRADTTFSGHVLLANNVSSASTVTQPAVQQVHNPLANDVKSNSSVTQPTVKQLHGLLANDGVSASSVGSPALVQIVPPVALLANDVLSTSSVTNPSVQQRQVLLANDILSASSVSQPSVKQSHGVLANDVQSNSTVSQPVVKSLQGLLANDITSGSSVGQPIAVIRRDLLANDVKSNSSVGQPAVQQVQGLLANDVTSASKVGNPIVGIVGIIDARDVVSASSVSQPTLQSIYGLNANDVLSASSAGQPAAIVGRAILANDVVSGSSVSPPALVHIVGSSALLANDVLSASSVTTPIITQRHVVDAADIVSASSVTPSALGQVASLAADDVTAASSVSVPLFGEIPAGAILADNVTSASSVSQPGLHLEQTLFADNVISASFVSAPMVDRPEVEVPELGGGGPAYGRGYSRKRWEELLRRLEEERQAALQRAQAFPSNKDRQKARKVARAASQAIAAALQAADEAAEVAHAGAITRSLEAAAEAKGIAEYLAAMKAAREEAIEMELDDEDETVLMMVA